MKKNEKITNLPFHLEGHLNKLFVGADIIKNKNYKDVEFLVDKHPSGNLCALVGKAHRKEFPS